MSDQRREPVDPDLLSKKEVARLLTVSPRTVTRYVTLGRLPPPIRFSRSCVRWRRQDIGDFLRRLADAGRVGKPPPRRQARVRQSALGGSHKAVRGSRT